ncbi:Mpo1-like protein [Ideonella sp. DXS29W]|uniref:Mpo1-like protein n=1 Tax=Ideonella lacteola TaxID=2984193 RepID=A0ABU9BUU6_9BURK
MPSPFRPARELLVQYARYHRDRRNIATHFVGIPMIVFALCVLLARPVLDVSTPAGILALTPAVALWTCSTLWYLTRGEFLLGVAVSLVNGVLVMLAGPAASIGTVTWLAWGLGLFLLGWVIQFLGHLYEGRKPAFTDDLIGLLVGPQFVTAEALFSFGLLRGLRDEIERRAGPTHVRDLALPA